MPDDDRTDRGQGVGAGLGQRRQPELTHIGLHRGDFRKQRDFAPRRLELLRFLEAQADGVVIARAGLERGGGFVGNDAAIGDDDGARAHLVHLLQDVGRNDHQFVLAQLVDQAPHFVFLIRVEPIGGLVQDQDLRIVDQRLGQADAAPESFGERFDDLFDHGRESQTVDHDGAPFAPLFAREAAHIGDEIQKFADGHFAVARSTFRQISHAGFGRHR